jgi:hypothetical protein
VRGVDLDVGVGVLCGGHLTATLCRSAVRLTLNLVCSALSNITEHLILSSKYDTQLESSPDLTTAVQLFLRLPTKQLLAASLKSVSRVIVTLGAIVYITCYALCCCCSMSFRARVLEYTRLLCA